MENTQNEKYWKLRVAKFQTKNLRGNYRDDCRNQKFSSYCYKCLEVGDLGS
jgi:hypothetical protein